jgi:hypothetical protein
MLEWTKAGPGARPAEPTKVIPVWWPGHHAAWDI